MLWIIFCQTEREVGERAKSISADLVTGGKDKVNKGQLPLEMFNSELVCDKAIMSSGVIQLLHMSNVVTGVIRDN